MVAKSRVYWNFETLEGIFNDLGDHYSRVRNFLVGVVPIVVGSVVSCPEEKVGLRGVSNVLHHALESIYWKIAITASKYPGLVGRYSGITPLFSAAQIARAIC